MSFAPSPALDHQRTQTTICRVLAVLTYIRNNPDCGSSEIARELPDAAAVKFCERTLARDLSLLRRLGLVRRFRANRAASYRYTGQLDVCFGFRTESDESEVLA